VDDYLPLPAWLKGISKDCYLLKKGFRSGSRNHKLFLMLLSDNKELCTMWTSLKRHSKESDEYLFLDFSHDVESALTRTKFSRHSRVQRKEYANKISKCAEELSELLKESDFDTSIYSAMNENTQKRLAHKTPFPEDYAYNWHTLEEMLVDETAFLWVSDFLMQLSEMAKMKGNTQDVIQTSNTDNAAQVYYIRRLTKQMIVRYNTPMRRVVAISASIIFDNHKIDVPYVAKYAP
jgi:hypothetical protein